MELSNNLAYLINVDFPDSPVPVQCTCKVRALSNKVNFINKFNFDDITKEKNFVCFL